MNAIFNANQIASIVRTVLKFIAAFLIAHGYTAAGNHVNLLNTAQIVGGVIGAIGTIWSLVAHSGGSNGNGSQQGTLPLSIFILFGSLALASFGCSSAPANMYKTEASADTSVSAAMTTWGNYVAEFHPGTNVELQVESAFNKYQQAELLAIDLTAAYAATVSTNSTASAVPETTAWQSVSQAAGDLAGLISQSETQTNVP